MIYSRNPELFQIETVQRPGALPTLNPDGVSVRGCDYIYPPKGQAGEYAPLAANPYRGCGHACAYCYVPRVTRQDRKDFDAGAVERPNYLKHLTADAKKYQALGLTGQVMLSFTTDPFPPAMHILTRQVLEALRDHGLAFCTLTKGGTRSFRDLDLFRPTRDAFASTLTTLDDKFSKKWERGAALPADRIAALRKFHNAGIFTWVSLEPTLSIESSLQIVRETHSFVDLYKIGRANYLPMTTVTDWESYTHRMIELVHKLNIKHYFKKDLQPYLPKGYFNPLRIQQHH
jgi:DNA repair photolyase